MAVVSAQSAAPAAKFVVTPDQAEDLLIELESAAFDGRIGVDADVEHGEIVIHRGSILHARIGKHEGRDALQRILAVSQGRWTVHPCVIADGIPVVTGIDALMERDEARQLHWNELCSHAPPMGSVFRLSTAGEFVRDSSSGHDASLLSLVDGRRTLMQVLEAGTTDPVDALERLLEAIQHGLLRSDGTRTSLFPLAATAESSGYMPRSSPTRGSEAATDVPRHSISGGSVPSRVPVVDVSAASEEPLTRPYLAKARHCIGRYEVLMRIGSGGMGTVYLCRTQSEQTGFRRLFALKLLRSHLCGNAQATHEFLDEARVAGILHHANVVGVTDAGFHGHRPYLVMDYVEGCSLMELMKGWPGRVPRFLLPIVIDALSGLHALHTLRDEAAVDLHLVHCDISPENLLVGVDGVCRLTDFGVARRANVLPSGMTRGKLGYVAPERMAEMPFDHRADIFSMGVVLWNCLTGSNLLATTTVGEGSVNAGRLRIPRPSDLGAESSDDLDRIIMRALSLNPDDRQSSAEEMLNELRQVALTGWGLATARDIVAWVRHVAGPELTNRRLLILDASRNETAKMRDFPSSKWLGASDPDTDNIPILLTRRSSIPPRLDEPLVQRPASNLSAHPATNGAEFRDGTAPSTSSTNHQPSVPAISNLFYTLDDVMDIDEK